MTNNVVARRYAGALFSLGEKLGNGERNRLGQYLADLAQAMTENPALEAVFKSPVISASEKKAIAGAILDKLDADKTIRNFCFLLADKERLGALRDIAESYGSMLDEANGVLRGTVTTAIKLDAERQASLKDALQKKAGREMELSFHVDPDILGGLVVSIGDRVMDASLKAQLGIMRELLKRGS